MLPAIESRSVRLTNGALYGRFFNFSESAGPGALSDG